MHLHMLEKASGGVEWHTTSGLANLGKDFCWPEILLKGGFWVGRPWQMPGTGVRTFGLLSQWKVADDEKETRLLELVQIPLWIQSGMDQGKI